ncbi:MAG: hypothetical protein AVDCRST_MAG28-2559 [uncultured Rubrobacteraceae bacterium]|uniref:Uncharacterized protein n=1 Tax=uncultured Rubrobacteraceae bacterium TaxID=349277 RepID=A0A6J4R3J6_9ACTN|nr:MAG: hypothetical protein AVDCRST_MAG28-2559 [uncultured Rubrobacteraceae bacterium]
MVEGEARAMREVFFGSGEYGIEVAGGYARLEDKVSVSFGDALSVIQNYKGTISASAERGGDVDVTGAGIARVTEKLVEGVLDVEDTPRTAAGAFGSK